jgi:hypothetical protein
MLNTSNISTIEKYLNKEQKSRKIEVLKATHSTKRTRRNRRYRGTGINTSYSKKLRRSLKANPKLIRSLRKLLRSKQNQH